NYVQTLTFIFLMNSSPAANIGLPQWGLTCFFDIFVVNQSVVLRLNFCAKNPPLRQAENRYIELDKLLWCSTGFSASMGIVFFLAAQAGFQVLAVRPCK